MAPKVFAAAAAALGLLRRGRLSLPYLKSCFLAVMTLSLLEYIAIPQVRPLEFVEEAACAESIVDLRESERARQSPSVKALIRQRQEREPGHRL